METCHYCKEPASFYMKSSQRWSCSSSVNSCPEKRRLDSVRKKGKNPFESREHPRGMLGKTQTIKGKTYIEFYGQEEADRLSNLRKTQNLGLDIWKNVSPENRKAHADRARENILARYEKGWMPKAGRCRKIIYESPIAGTVRLDGSWEHKVAEYLDQLGVKWNRNTARFPYMDDNGKNRHYTPDFWIEDWNTFLEVKGYETKLDRAKWRQFPKPLIVWKKDDIIKAGIKI